MSLKNEEDSSKKHKEFVFLLAIAGLIDAQSVLLAQELEKDRTIHHVYNVFDSLSSSYSMFKFFFEVCISSSNDPDLMRRVLCSPQGMSLFISEALFLVSFAFFASYFEKEKNKEPGKRDEMKYFIAASWPYFRDMMKGMKNAYKGWKSVVQIIGILGLADLKSLIIPVGLALGLVATLNRFLQRSTEEQRKKKMTANKDLLKRLNDKNMPFLTKEEHEDYLRDPSKIQYQTMSERMLDILARALGGLIDSLYLYAGVIGLALLTPEVFTVMAVFTLVFSMACIASRIYEGYEAQRELLATQTRCKLALVAKELETTYAKLARPENMHCAEMKRDASDLMARFIALHKELNEQTTASYTTVFFLGVKNGLFAYGVLTSFLFMATSVFSVSTALFPPALLIAIISSGIASIIGVTSFLMRSHQHYLQEQGQKHTAAKEALQQLERLQNNLNFDNGTAPSVDSLKQWLNEARKPAEIQKSLTQEWLEVFRSFFSGISKGNNFASLIAIAFLQTDPQDHEHGPSAMLMLTVASAAVFSTVLALRALARGLGRDNAAKNKEVSTSERTAGEATKTKAAGESSEGTESPPASLKRTLSFQNIYNFFRPNDTHQPSVTPREHKVQGLT
ncbi:hypothetical protein [Legionella saoudiensis]|uniref:hypothetical protein n=1 Tax=Legionella saoudiensis TaxID=1750561 RepID=UPI0007318243|nr:hypothetical protein [Legionella saoudiensis]